MKLDISSKTDQIDELEAAHKPLRENPLVWNPFIKALYMWLAWNSNSLEGNTLSLSETVAIVEFDEVRAGHTYSEYTEAISMHHAVCRKLDFEDRVPLSISWIQSANADIMHGSGAFREKDVCIGTLAEAVFYPPHYTEVPGQMEKYAESLLESSQQDTASVIKSAAGHHIAFERIHPFADGNGRTGRLILNRELLNAGLMPAIIIDGSKYRQAFTLFDRSQNTNMMEYLIACGIIKTHEVLEEIYRQYSAREK